MLHTNIFQSSFSEKYDVTNRINQLAELCNCNLLIFSSSEISEQISNFFGTASTHLFVTIYLFLFFALVFQHCMYEAIVCPKNTEWTNTKVENQLEVVLAFHQTLIIGSLALSRDSIIRVWQK